MLQLIIIIITIIIIIMIIIIIVVLLLLIIIIMIIIIIIIKTIAYYPISEDFDEEGIKLTWKIVSLYDAYIWVGMACRN